MRHKPVSFAAALVLCAAARVFAQTTLVPNAPHFVTGPGIWSMDWSPGGRYLLVVRQDTERWVFDRPPKSSAALVLWDQQKGESKWILRSEEHIPQVHWLARTNDAYVTLQAFGTDTPTEIWRVEARTGTVTRVPGVAHNVDVSTSPTQPWAVVYGQDEGGGFVRSLDRSGALGPRVALNQRNAVLWGWTPDGNAAVFFGTAPAGDAPPPGPPDAPATPEKPAERPLALAFTPGTGQITAVPDHPKLYQEAPSAAPFTLSTTEMKTSKGPRDSSAERAPFTPAVHPLWLEQKGEPDFQRLFVAADADAFVVSPRNDAVAYANREGAFVVPLEGVPTATLRKARTAAERSQILNDAKQVGLALIMHAQDNGDAYPAAGSDLNSLLGPYLKDPSILNGNGGFQYTFGGGSVGGIENPAETVLGYFNGPGGRGTVYADGHVTWEP